MNENRFCFHQFLNIFFKAAIVFLLIIAGVDITQAQIHPLIRLLMCSPARVTCQSLLVLVRCFSRRSHLFI
jgi:hypothetical protein